jgi:hypothetical protein
MSFQITAAFVDQFSGNVEHLTQQGDSRFAGKTRVESQKGKTKFFEQLGATRAVRRTSRHADTPRVDSNHQRRACYLNDYDWSDLVDTLDETKLLIDPKSSYAQSAAMAFNRAKDEEIITAATASSYADKDGTGAVIAVALPSTQKVAVNLGGGANTGLTLAKLIESKSILGKAEYPKGSTLYYAYTQQQLDDLLLNVSQVSNSDYAAVKALVDGEVSYFMGFEFIKTELLTLTTATDIRTTFAYVKQGLLLSTGQDMQSRISERADKNYATQVYANMSVGATRMQEEQVVEIMCDESP